MPHGKGMGRYSDRKIDPNSLAPAVFHSGIVAQGGGGSHRTTGRGRGDMSYKAVYRLRRSPPEKRGSQQLSTGVA